VAVSKALQSILDEMEIRRVEYIHASNADKKIDVSGVISYPGRLTSSDLIASPAVGDLVISKGNDICLILEQLGKDSYTACRLSGFLYEVSRFELAMNLGKVVDASVLKDCTRVVTIDGVSEKILVRQLAGPINALFREFRSAAENSRPKVKAALASIIDRIRLDQKSTLNIPFFEMVRQVEQIAKTPMSKTDLNSTSLQALFGELPDTPIRRIAFTVDPLYVLVVHSLLKDSFYKNILFNNTPDKSQLQMLSIMRSSWELAYGNLPRMHFTKLLNATDDKQLTFLSRISDGFTDLVKGYALDDIPQSDPEARSSAILGLKELKELRDDSIDPGRALKVLAEKKLVNTSIGPFFDQIRYEFLKKHASTLAHLDLPFTAVDTVQGIRKDFGSVNVYCIDAENSLEIDDGISVRLSNGANIATVSVHIADPISAVESFRQNTFLRTAYKTSSTAYFPVGAIPMLHRNFTGPFSLTANNGPKRCLTVSFDFNLQSKVLVKNSTSISYHTIENIRQITYDRVNEILSSNGNDQVAIDLSLLNQISQSLLENRKGKGAVTEFEPRASVAVKWSENKEPIIDLQVPSPIFSPSQALVSELMIAANSLIATYTKNNEIPSLYRSQRSGNIETSLPGQMAEPSWESAVISQGAAPHHSLALDNYSHSTSPLRRFQDLVVHWQLKCHFLGKRQILFSDGELSIMSVAIQSLQQLIKEAQNKSSKYWILRKLEILVTGNPHLKVSCTVSREPTRQDFENDYQQVYCDEFGISLPLRLSNKKPYPVGTRLTCAIIELNPTCLKAALTA
jgi:hypothetical protein